MRCGDCVLHWGYTLQAKPVLPETLVMCNIDNTKRLHTTVCPINAERVAKLREHLGVEAREPEAECWGCDYLNGIIVDKEAELTRLRLSNLDPKHYGPGFTSRYLMGKAKDCESRLEALEAENLALRGEMGELKMQMDDMMNGQYTLVLNDNADIVRPSEKP